ncbi:MAG: amino acid permease [Ignavibacteriales bacterium]|nr:amino acid permease [Ignavibacteriales bacterium]
MNSQHVESSTEQPQSTLARRLTLTNAIMVVIGSVIGSGIFLTPQNVAANVDIPGLMIGVWILTGLLTLAGALTNAEVASLIPEAGGQYVFFRVTFGQLTAFLYGWTTFIVYQTGSIAAIAVAFAKYFGYFVDLPNFGPALEGWQMPLIGEFYPLKDIGITMVAILAVVTVTTINYFGVQFGGMIQNVFTVLKVVAIGSIIVLAFTSGKGNTDNFFPLWGTPSSGALLAAFGVAMIATLWSYDGWNSLTYLAGEVIEPQKNIPRALIFGTLAVIVIYVTTNLAYLYILPIGQIAQSKLVAADVMNAIFYGWGGAIISAMVMISTFGTVNATSMTTARVFYAMAKDKMFFKSMGQVHPKFRTPAKSLVVQGTWASILCLTGTYDQIFTYVIFAGWIFYALGAAAVFILRSKQPNAVRSYKVPWYPVIPIVFIIVATWFVYNTIVEQTADSMVGLLLLVAGIPFYLYWQNQMKKA